jgi:hypothetical protein
VISDVEGQEPCTEDIGVLGYNGRRRAHFRFLLLPLLNSEWVDLPALGLAAMADAAC